MKRFVQMIATLFVAASLSSLLLFFLFNIEEDPDIIEAQEDSVKKGLYTDVEIGVNYITHLYTLAELGFEDSKYVEQYGHTVPKEDLKVLAEHASLLSFARGQGGELSQVFYFVPASINLSSSTEWDTYYQNMRAYAIDGDMSIVFPYLKKMYEKTNLSPEIASKEIIDIGDQIADIFIRNFDQYEKEVWPEIQPKLAKKALKFNRELVKFNYISSWEKATGLSYKKSSLPFHLFYAGINGPSFNNLGHFENSMHYSGDILYNLDMISHEFGVLLMIPTIKEAQLRLQEEDVPQEVTYLALESLAHFYNSMVLDRITLDYSDDKFVTIYEQLYSEGYHIPLELYTEGIQQYISKHK